MSSVSINSPAPPVVPLSSDVGDKDEQKYGDNDDRDATGADSSDSSGSKKQATVR